VGLMASKGSLPSAELFYSMRSNIAQTKQDGLRLARPREFDEGTAVEAAMQRFWVAGYAATSVRDLGEAMGLGQASVYNAFGDKRTLFTQCLDRYLDANMRARIYRVEKTLPPREAIETFLAEIVERSLESRLGCMLANAALELAPHDTEIATVVAKRMSELEAFFSAMRDRGPARRQHIGRSGCRRRRPPAADNCDGAACSCTRPSKTGGSQGCRSSGTQHARKTRSKTKTTHSLITGETAWCRDQKCERNWPNPFRGHTMRT
jgi:AcrR family transcriptional regulator